jgi:hypothetical protein
MSIRRGLVLVGLLAAWACSCAWGVDGYLPARDEVLAYGTYWITGDGDFEGYDNGYGLELQVRRWFEESPFGGALSLGWADWNVEGGNRSVPPMLRGSATLFPLGGSALYRPVESESFGLALELGLRYVLVSSDAAAVDEQGRSFDVQIDDGFVALAAADYTQLVSEQVSLRLGVGYQIDVVEGDFEADGRTLSDSELKGFYLRIGALFMF